MKKLLKLENLTFIGAALGILCGVFTPDIAEKISLLGELFIQLLKMIIVPLVLVSVFLAVARQENVKGLSKLGSKTAIYFFVTSSLACLTGLVAALFLPKNTGSTATYENYSPDKLGSLSLKEIFLNFISSNPFKSLAEGEIIQIVVLALLVGVACLQLDAQKKNSLVHLFEALNDIVMILIRWILYFAPVGVFSLVASVIASSDKEAFTGLAWLFISISIAVVIHAGITLPLLGYFFGKFNPYRFVLRVREALLVALATASSSATLPVSTRVMEKGEKVDVKTSGFVLPLGATINMDGSSIYQTLIVLYFAELAGIEVGVVQQLIVFLLILVSSVGTAGIPGGGILMLGAVMQQVGVPLEYLGLYLLVDRLWDPIITMMNVYSDLFGAKIIDRYQSIGK